MSEHVTQSVEIDAVSVTFTGPTRRCPKCGRFICDDRATCEGLR